MQRRISDAKARLVEKVINAAKTRTTSIERLDIEEYIRQYFRLVSAEDLRETSSDNLAGAALAHLEFARIRRPGEIKTRILNPTARTDGWKSTHGVLQVVTDDRPFLVDSLGAAINSEDLGVHLTIHPMLRVQRDAEGRLIHLFDTNETGTEILTESYIQIEFDRITDANWLERIERRVAVALNDVKAATTDWRQLLAQAEAIRAELTASTPPGIAPEDFAEAGELLKWMTEDNFTFLGYREYRLERSAGQVALVPLSDSGLGILRGPGSINPQSDNPVLDKAIRKQARSNDVVIITKANSRSTVHRPAHLDYIGVKTYDDAGQVAGEKRFLGLFTSAAYSRSPREIPILRHKVEQIMKRSGLVPASHGGKALMHILEHYPRDELFQSTIEDLSRIADGILGLQERQRVKLFVRRDTFRRFFSCLVFAPRDKYNTDVRQHIEKILLDSMKGLSVESEVQLSDSNLARLYLIVRTLPETSSRVSLKNVEKEIVEAVRTWQDGLRDELVKRLGEEQGLNLFQDYCHCFPAAYEEDVTPHEATFDVERIHKLRNEPDGLRMSLYRPPSFNVSRVRFKVFRRHDPIPLSEVLPMLENMGLLVISERPYRVDLNDAGVVWVQDFEMTSDLHERLVPADVNEIFQETFANTWRGKTESDGFNKLTLVAHMGWRFTTLLRAYCRYLLQTGLPFSQPYMEEVMVTNHGVAQAIVDEFVLRFDPAIDSGERRQRLPDAIAASEAALDAVSGADEDRILRSFLATIRATLRTNFFQHDADEAKPYVSFKLNPQDIPDLPEPLPVYEVFVYSPRVEGVHLRGGSIARGGLRWSDRREDFRTEVLGLMKAQKVKNTLIVPTGAKGGFVCKQLPDGGRDLVMVEVVSCYRQFVSGLLDITDNLVDGEAVPPALTVRRDDNDPYLVVAADKGTATFSDTANDIARGYQFWLGDAFASGGSVGYDHKGMGITAKGGWEAVKRHFRELGTNVQTEPFTACAIGDMGGDVFGNGMLRSRETKLVAAFNHMHIFVDPHPDPATSFDERQRLFDLPRSSWADYDASLMSAGGGVFSRHDKRIPVSQEMREVLAIGGNADSVTPTELIKAILCAPVDLLWNGGIGTYVKSSAETHAEAGDRANDAVRVNGRDLHCKVLGEGGNLGLTQLGRIECTHNDVRINTDFIDNAGGVNCSDREVNIKILLNLVVSAGDLDMDARNELLAQMTDEVEELVLRDNYLQTQALSVVETDAALRAIEHAHLIRELEMSGELDRDLEYLPTDEDIIDRHRGGRGLTRPELAVLLSYSKISLFDDLAKSSVADDAYLAAELSRYFPEPLKARYRDRMRDHPLAREIIATQITNSLINRMGPSFVRRTQEETGASAEDIARAFTIAREAFGMRSLWHEIERLDNELNASSQYSMMAQTSRLLRRASGWLLNHSSGELDVATQVARYQPGIEVIAKKLPTLLIGTELDRFSEAAELYLDIGVPRRLANRLAGMRSLFAGLDIVDVAEETHSDTLVVASAYYRLGAALSMDWTRDQVERLKVSGRWHALARGSLRENMDDIQRTITASVIRGADGQDSLAIVDAWLEDNAPGIERVQNVLHDMRTAGNYDFATLSVAIQETRKLGMTSHKGQSIGT